MDKADAWLRIAEGIDTRRERIQYLCLNLLGGTRMRLGIEYEPEMHRRMLYDLNEAIRDSNTPDWSGYVSANPQDWYLDDDFEKCSNDWRILLCLFFALENDETVFDWEDELPTIPRVEFNTLAEVEAAREEG